MIKQPKFDAETVIADFLGDLHDIHPRLGGGLNSTSYDRLRYLAKILISDLAENDLSIALTSSMETVK